MMAKRWQVILFIVLLAAIVFVWQLPSLLKAIPSRYVARLPEPLQQLGVREHVEVLPTASFSGDETDLVLAAPILETTPTAPPGPPATPTPPPTASVAVSSTVPTVSPSPTATPTPTATSVPIPVAARLSDPLQHSFQTWNNCGPATLAMSLTYFGIFHTQDQTAAILKPDPEDRNVSPEEMAAYVNNHTELSALTRTNGDLDTLRRLISNDFPVIVELGIDPPGEFRWLEWYGHYLLVVAYDDVARTVWVFDSWFGTSEVPLENADDEGRVISYDELDRYWRQFNRDYIVLHRPEDASDVAAIIGSNMNDSVMWQGALTTVQSELRLEPEDEFLWFNLGTIYNALGDFDRAASAFDKARTIGLPWRMLWYQFGPYEAYYRTGRFEDVILLADVTLQDRPYFEESYYYKGLAQIELGLIDEARENLEKAVAFNPNFNPAVQALQELELASR